MTKKILFVYTNFSTFVKTDFDILSAAYNVEKYQFKPAKGIFKVAWQMLRQKLFLLFNLWKFDAVYIWFADYHSFLPVLFAKITGKKSFLVVGGYDVVKMPKLNYGVFTSKLRGFCAIFSMKNSTINLAVSKNVERKVRWIAKKSNTTLIYNCVNIPENQKIQTEKENLVITVGSIDSERTFYIKGIDTFIEVARLLPEIRFLIVGLENHPAKNYIADKPENLEIIGRVEHQELVGFYRKAKVYCQLSRSESFGVAVVEAMSFGCIPVVTNVGGLPELVGDSGKIVKRQPQQISEQVKNIVLNFSAGKVPFDGLKVTFSVETRKKKLLQAIETVLKG